MNIFWMATNNATHTDPSFFFLNNNTMNTSFDEGFNDDDLMYSQALDAAHAGALFDRCSDRTRLESGTDSVQECEGVLVGFTLFNERPFIHAYYVIELVYRLLAFLPRSRLATIQRRIAPLLQFDVVGVRVFLTSSKFALFNCIHRSVPPNRSLLANIQPSLIADTPPMLSCLPPLACPR